MSEKVLVTGGTGYIGSHTVVELQQAGYEVFIIDNLHNSEIGVLDGIEEITGIRPEFDQFDICNTDLLEKYFQEKSDIRAIVHFAAYKSVGESVKKPLQYYHNNLVSTINLLSMMDRYGINNLIFSSSCTVYGEPAELPVTEKSPIQPAISPYGNSKQICEEIIIDTVRSGEPASAISLRYFNPIGAHPSALIGELPRGIPENLVPYITQTASGIRKELSVFGDDYDTPDGSCIRDYLHVVDLAKAHVMSVTRMLSGKNLDDFEIFNLGTGKGVSVFDAIKSFERVSGVKVNWRIAPRRAGDIEKIWADPSYANRELGWETISTLDQAMKSAWDWEMYYRKKI